MSGRPASSSTLGSALRARLRRIDVGLLFALCAAFILVAVPAWVIIVNSWKPASEALDPGLGLPADWRLIENYRTVVDEGDYFLGVRNSLIVLIPTLVLTLLTAAMAAWVLARVTGRRGWRAAQAILLVGLIVPPAVITTLRLLRIIGLGGSQLGLVAVYVALFIPVGVLLFTGFIKTIPHDLEEAATIDGASQVRVFRSVILPLMRPVIITSAFIIAVAIWNDYYFAYLVLTDGQSFTVALGLFNYASKFARHVAWELVFANVVLTSFPLLLLYVFVHRNVVDGISASGENR